MKIIEALRTLNPQITAESLICAYKKMSEREFRVSQADMLVRARKFAEAIDNNFSASLEDGERITYASVCESFAKALKKAEKQKNEIKEIAMFPLAEVIGWWHLLDNVRSVATVSD